MMHVQKNVKIYSVYNTVVVFACIRYSFGNVWKSTDCPTSRYIIVFTRAHHLHLSLGRWFLWVPSQLMNWRFVLIHRVRKRLYPFFIFFFSRCPVCGEWCKLHWLLLDTPSFDWNTRCPRGHKMFKMAPTKQQKAFCAVEYAKTTSGAFAFA